MLKFTFDCNARIETTIYANDEEQAITYFEDYIRNAKNITITPDTFSPDSCIDLDEEADKLIPTEQLEALKIAVDKARAEYIGAK